MAFGFATCDRKRALGFLQKLYPSAAIEDTPEDAAPVLDLVARDVIRISDPDFHGGMVVASTHYAEVPADEIQTVLRKFHEAALARTA